VHIGYNNGNMVYEINGKKLYVVTEERDLGTIKQNYLKCGKQCSKAVKTEC
jgi:hypothetical protein